MQEIAADRSIDARPAGRSAPISRRVFPIYAVTIVDILFQEDRWLAALYHRYTSMRLIVARIKTSSSNFLSFFSARRRDINAQFH